MRLSRPLRLCDAAVADQAGFAGLGSSAPGVHHGGVTRHSLSASTNAPDFAAGSATTSATRETGVETTTLSAVAPDTALVSKALDSATPAALLAGAIDAEQV